MSYRFLAAVEAKVLRLNVDTCHFLDLEVETPSGVAGWLAPTIPEYTVWHKNLKYLAKLNLPIDGTEPLSNPCLRKFTLPQQLQTGRGYHAVYRCEHVLLAIDSVASSS